VFCVVCGDGIEFFFDVDGVLELLYVVSFSVSESYC